MVYCPLLKAEKMIGDEMEYRIRISTSLIVEEGLWFDGVSR